MRRLAVAALLAVAPALPQPAFAQAYQCVPPRRIGPLAPPRPDGPARRKPVTAYILAASWSPEYCRFDSNRETMQCSGRNGLFGFVLHGLWPQSAYGAPLQWCPTSRRPSPDLIRRNLCMTPVPWLLEYEWAKHGSCMVRKPETYFKVSDILWQSLRWPDADYLSRKDGLTAGDLREAFVRINRDWTTSQIGIETSRTGWLRGVRLCYGKNFMPRDCPKATYGSSDDASLKIWRGL